MDYSKPDNALPFSAPRSEREELLLTLRAENERTSDSHTFRRQYRFKVEECIVDCRIEHPGGGLANIEMLVSDISASGIGVVSRVYLHTNTICTFTLTTNFGKKIKASGLVIWCKLVAKQFHAAGVMFDEPIDPKEVVSPKAWLECVSNSVDFQSEMLRGKVMHIEDNPIYTKLIEMMLINTNITLTPANDTGAALDLVKLNSFDAVLIGLAMSQSALDTFLNSLTREGYQGPIIFIDTDQTDSVIDHLVSLGHKYFLSTPILIDTLRIVLHNALQETNDLALGTSPIYSQLTDADVKEHWIIEYVEEIYRLANTLESAIKADDFSAVLSICNTFQATGAGYGFSLLSDTASDAIKALNASCSAKESASDLRRVLRLVERILPPEKSSGAGGS